MQPPSTERPPRDQSLFDAEPERVAAVQAAPSSIEDAISIRRSFQAMWEREQVQVVTNGDADAVIEGTQSQDESARATGAHVDSLQRALTRPLPQLFSQTHRWLDPEAPPRTRRGQVIEDSGINREAREAIQTDLDSSRELLDTVDVRDWTDAMGLLLDAEQVSSLKPAWETYLRGVDLLLVQLRDRVADKTPLQIQELKRAMTSDIAGFHAGTVQALKRVPFVSPPGE